VLGETVDWTTDAERADNAAFANEYIQVLYMHIECRDQTEG
jgi:hypothetical protein